MKHLKKHNLIIFFIPILTLLIFNAKFLFANQEEIKVENNQCIICHQENEMMPKDFQNYDIHLQKDLSCVGCHGGDPNEEDEEISMSKKNGFVGVPSKKNIPEFCGKCHSKIEVMRTYQPRIPTDQVQQFNTSIHGIKLKKGDKKVADCTNCHTTHGILNAKDPRASVYPLNVPNTCRKCHSKAGYMKEYKIPTNQYEQYSQSVHGIALLEKKDIGAPTCNDCHGNHGAMPPGITSISHVCGTCHVNNMNYFSSSPMAAPFEKLNLHGCEQCHGNHEVRLTSDEMIGVENTAMCVNCHEKGDKGYIAANNIREYIDNLVSNYNIAIEKWQKVQQIEMDDDEIGFLLLKAKQSLIHSRTMIHLFKPDLVLEKTKEGEKKIQEATDLAETEIKEHLTRRIGFGAATLIIAILIIALFLKIREIGKK